MADSATDISESMRCPTCNATQPWSDECRRCKSDLRMLRGIAAAWQQHREAALIAFRDGNKIVALNEAQAAFDLNPDTKSRQLLAACHLLAGNSLLAIQMASDVP